MSTINLILTFIAGLLLGLVLGANLYAQFPSEFSSLLAVQPKTSLPGDIAAKTPVAPKKAIDIENAPPIVPDAYFCPTVKVIKANLKTDKNWHDQGLLWSFDHRSFDVQDNIRFGRALLRQSNSELVCYYTWPNPEDKKTRHWLTVSLNLTYNQKATPLGSHWSEQNGFNQLLNKKKDKSYTACNSTLVKTCAFKIGR